MSGSSFTDFFTPNGTLAALNNTASGIEDVGTLMDAMLPDDGSIVWNVSCSTLEQCLN